MITLFHLLRSCLWTVPVFTVFWSVTTLGITYGIAAAMNHTSGVFPYISKTGTEIPERGVFSFSVIVIAIAMAMNAEIRFHYIRLMMAQLSLTPSEKTRWININKVALCLGLVAALGLLGVASFQVDEMPVPHYMGAFITFGFGLLCCWLHAAMTYKLYKEERKSEFKYTFVLQIIVSLLVTVVFLSFIGSFASYRYQRSQGYGTKEGKLKSIFHAASVSEWVLAISVISYVLTFIPGFKKLEFDGFNVKWKAPGSSSKTSVCWRLCTCCS